MLIVDAASLYHVIIDAPRADEIRALLLEDSDLAAPHIVDVEVLGLIRRDYLLGELDSTAARLAVEDLRDWPGVRFPHQPFIERAWQIRQNVRTWDAFYVALAEAMDATLVTRDRRLARAPGLRCRIQIAGI